MKVLVTAGPTREYIDDVRYITNSSSGLMGASIAKKALERGWDATLIIGSTHIKPPEGVKLINVLSAAEMTDKTLKELDRGYDALVSAAAIADYTPTERKTGKIRSGGEMTVRMKKTEKLIKLVRERKPDITIVAFKAEYGGGGREQMEAAKKLLEYADYVVLNDISADVFGSTENEVTIVGEDGVIKKIGRCKKDIIASEILDILSK
jgi:phosphopantothenoylcysteine decarboxylase / phosphopantothenate---cysteine ligase